MVGSCEHNNEPSAFQKGDYFDQLNTYKLLINKSGMFWDVPPLS